MAASQHTAPNPSDDNPNAAERLDGAIVGPPATRHSVGALRATLDEISLALYHARVGMQLIGDTSNQFSSSLPAEFAGRVDFLCEAIERAIARADVAFNEAWAQTEGFESRSGDAPRGAHGDSLTAVDMRTASGCVSDSVEG